MKLTLTYLLMLPLSLMAQNKSYSNEKYALDRVRIGNDSPIYFELDQIRKFKLTEDKPIESVNIVRSNKKGKAQYASTYFFNSKQQLTHIETDETTVNINYFNDSLVRSIHRIGKKPSSKFFYYQENKKVLEENFEDGKLKSRTVVVRDSIGRPLYSSIAGKNNFSMLYSYRGDQLEEQRYMKNDKVVTTWTYSCDQKGLNTEEENRATICKYTSENNDGSYINYYRKVENGDVVLYKHYFDKEDYNYQSEAFKKDSVLIWKMTQSPSVKNYFNYDKKGHLRKQIIYEYDSDGNNVLFGSYNSYKGKPNYEHLYTYDEHGRLIKSLFKSKGKLYSTVAYSYQPYP